MPFCQRRLCLYLITILEGVLGGYRKVNVHWGHPCLLLGSQTLLNTDPLLPEVHLDEYFVAGIDQYWVYWWRVWEHGLQPWINSNLWYLFLLQPTYITWRILFSLCFKLANILPENAGRGARRTRLTFLWNSQQGCVSKDSPLGLKPPFLLFLFSAYKHIRHFHWLQDLVYSTVCLYLISLLFALLCHITRNCPVTFQTVERVQAVTRQTSSSLQAGWKPSSPGPAASLKHCTR